MLASAAAALARARTYLARGAAEPAAERTCAAVIQAARAVLNETGERPRARAIVAARIEARAPGDLVALRRALAQAQEWRVAGEERLIDDVERLLDLAVQGVAEAVVVVRRGEPEAPHPARSRTARRLD